MAHLRPLQELGDLKIFKADLTDEESFDSSFLGCEYIFHVATPINFTSEDPEVCFKLIVQAFIFDSYEKHF